MKKSTLTSIIVLLIAATSQGYKGSNQKRCYLKTNKNLNIHATPVLNESNKNFGIDFLFLKDDVYDGEKDLKFKVTKKEIVTRQYTVPASADGCEPQMTVSRSKVGLMIKLKTGQILSGVFKCEEFSTSATSPEDDERCDQ